MVDVLFRWYNNERDWASFFSSNLNRSQTRPQPVNSRISLHVIVIMSCVNLRLNQIHLVFDVL